MRKGILWVVWIVLAILAAVLACNTTTAPELQPFPLGDGAGTSTPSSVPGVAPVVPTGDLDCRSWEDDGKYYVRCTNNLQYPSVLQAACFIIDGGSQSLFDFDAKTIEVGKTGTAVQPLPDCGDIGCGETLRAQCDGIADNEVPETYNWPDKIPGYITGTGIVINLGKCPDCPEPCTPIPCEPPFLYNPVTCTCSCPIECSEPHELNPETCTCECPTQPARCPPGHEWNEQTCQCDCTVTCEPPYIKEGCSCVCDIDHPCPEGHHRHGDDCKCYCDPVGEPECPEQVWDENLCQWVGDCICEPVGEPECPEQTWDEELCEWVGDCPCVCDLPDPHSFYKKNLPGDPRVECALFDLVPGKGECGIKIRKGGKCYEVTIESTSTGRPKVCCDLPYWPYRWCYGWSHTTYCKQECPK